MKNYRTHYKRCAYYECGLVNRVSNGAVSFFRLPAREDPRFPIWLVHSGLDDLADCSVDRLRKTYICSRHFMRSDFHMSGRLKKEACPVLYGEEIPEEEIIYDNSELVRVKEALEKEKQVSSSLRAQLKARSMQVKYLKGKLSSGCIGNDTLRKAIARRVSDQIFTFVVMLIFGQKKREYTGQERQMSTTLHSASPLAYNKMRMEFGFPLPSQSTIGRWLSNASLCKLEEYQDDVDTEDLEFGKAEDVEEYLDAELGEDFADPGEEYVITEHIITESVDAELCQDC